MTIYALSRILIPLYTVKVAKDGDMGLKLATENDIDLILSDIYMPSVSGFDVLEKLKTNERTKDIPVILISGTEEPEDKERGFSLGAIDFIKKPFNEKEVLQKIKRAGRASEEC